MWQTVGAACALNPDGAVLLCRSKAMNGLFVDRDRKGAANPEVCPRLKTHSPLSWLMVCIPMTGIRGMNSDETPWIACINRFNICGQQR